jgi:LmbE family N-acetylglucosaminyl deacetylase
MSIQKKDYKMIFAHPDDEVLWASSMIKDAKKILICFLESPGNKAISSGRKEAFKNFPINNVINLGIKEINATKHANWRNPSFLRYGIFHKSNHELYKIKYQELYKALKEELKKKDIVVTHNPWGEYGHEEHVLVYKVVAKLKAELQLQVYVTGYVSNRSIYAMNKSKALLCQNPLIYQTNDHFTSLISHHYKRHGIWTWWSDYKWPKYESFFLLEESKSKFTGKSSSELMNHILFNETNIEFRDVIKFFYSKILNFFR